MISEDKLDKILAKLAAIESMLAMPEKYMTNSSTQAEIVKITEQLKDKIPRGKYIGRLHSEIVVMDPAHVVWLADNGRAAGLGYTPEQIQEAQKRQKENKTNRWLRSDGIPFE